MNVFRVFFFFLTVISLSFDACAQQNVLHSDQRIQELSKDFIARNEKDASYYGYRVQIVSVSGAMSEERVKEEEKNFLDVYPEVYTYRIFESPNFKLRVGDFENRVTAEKFFSEVREDFPNAFVVKDKISIEALEKK